ncbi:hypothetical protein AAD018_001450 [Aestuariibius insulae]|uniref:hypothetical protein n=1 Tax=Aestuariibius insulae TaxID=2058287 RepID=UPI00345E1F60
MDGNVDSIDGASKSDPSATQTQLADLTREASREAKSIGHLNSAMELAASKVAVPPGTEASNQNLMDELRQGSVGEVKNEMMSDVTRPGTPSKEATPGEETAEIEDRFQKLYLELTNFQVAWAIARRTQQDVSQLLRGN